LHALGNTQQHTQHFKITQNSEMILEAILPVYDYFFGVSPVAGTDLDKIDPIADRLQIKFLVEHPIRCFKFTGINQRSCDIKSRQGRVFEEGWVEIIIWIKDPEDNHPKAKEAVLLKQPL
jgi:hypothetical protein